ncbi:MAG TPA: LysM peptidoglycan-binding domain-containing protein [Planctomycetota bacterium]|nr:LysM peptidoglycan-binding domain-containing protein [Planctomycetota bacterium]
MDKKKIALLSLLLLSIFILQIQFRAKKQQKTNIENIETTTQTEPQQAQQNNTPQINEIPPPLSFPLPDTANNKTEQKTTQTNQEKTLQVSEQSNQEKTLQVSEQSNQEKTNIPPETSKTFSYKVQSGDSLWKIARIQYKLSNNSEINHVVQYIEKQGKFKILRIGETIQLPSKTEIENILKK